MLWFFAVQIHSVPPLTLGNCNRKASSFTVTGLETFLPLFLHVQLFSILFVSPDLNFATLTKRRRGVSWPPAPTVSHILLQVDLFTLQAWRPRPRP